MVNNSIPPLFEIPFFSINAKAIQVHCRILNIPYEGREANVKAVVKYLKITLIPRSPPWFYITL